MKVPLSDIMGFMEEIAPSSTALSWDNVGLQIGDASSPVKSVLLSLDVSPRVVEEAAGMPADLIISHHPLIFSPIKKLDFSRPGGRMIRDLIRHNISLFTAHTNLDRSPAGTGMTLARRLGLGNIRSYSENPDDEMNMVITGEMDKPRSGAEMVELFRELPGCDHVRIVGNPYRVLTMAIIPGSAGSLVQKLTSHFDLIITGELSYHGALEADYQGRAVALLGHYVTEKPVMFNLKELLQERFHPLEIQVSDGEGEPYRIY